MTALQIFNRYREVGGEEKSVERIGNHLSDLMEIERCFFDSREWDGAVAPNILKQALLIGNNFESRRRVREASRSVDADFWLIHNVIPVASLGVYREASELGIPVMQYLHNFRPFSLSGSLWARGQVNDSGLRGNPFPEIFAASWQQSRLKSAILAFHFSMLLRSGALNCVRRWIAISDFMRDRMIEGGLPAERVVTIRHSWDAMRDVPNCADEGYYLLLARLVPEKGVASVLNAWKILQKEMGAACPKLIIGGTGPLEEEVRRAAEGQNTVEFAGFVEGERKKELIAGCRAMMAPSLWWEPLGIVTYESYDWRKPMIAARSGGLVETVEDGESGFLHVPGDPSDIARVISATESLSPVQRSEMGEVGRKWLLDHGSVVKWREKMARVAQMTLES